LRLNFYLNGPWATHRCNQAEYQHNHDADMKRWRMELERPEIRGSETARNFLDDKRRE